MFLFNRDFFVLSALSGTQSNGPAVQNLLELKGQRYNAITMYEYNDDKDDLSVVCLNVYMSAVA